MDTSAPQRRIYGRLVDAESNAIRVQDSSRAVGAPQCSVVCTNPELNVAQAQTLIDSLQRFIDAAEGRLAARQLEHPGFEEPSHDVRPDFR